MNKSVWNARSKFVRIALVAIAMLAIPSLAHAQSGCTDSPENPTVVLALVGSAGAGFTSLRRWLKARKK
ncbi:MAG TPA: PExPT-CTERM protein [Acidobacteriaceae bacterium]|jgi:XrtJ-associated TM-motif-TM protein